MSEIKDLDLAGLASLQAQIEKAQTALTAARDKRYAEAVLPFLDTVVAEIPMTETPTSAYAGHRVAFTVKGTNGREYLVSLDVRDVKRSAARKAAQVAKTAAAKA